MQSDAVASALTPSLVAVVVKAEGELPDGDDVVSVLCGLGSGSSLRRVEEGGGLVALSLLASKGKVKALRCLLDADGGRVVESGGHLSAVNVVCNRKEGPSESISLSLDLLTSLYSPSTSSDILPALQSCVSTIVASPSSPHLTQACGLLLRSVSDLEGRKRLASDPKFKEIRTRVANSSFTTKIKTICVC